MFAKNDDDIDYEHLDDVPLSERFEWHYLTSDNVVQEDTPPMEWLSI